MARIMDCPCGSEHQLSEAAWEAHRDLVARQGRTAVIAASGGAWNVPRLFVACHDPGADELAAIAKRYGFEPAGAGGESRTHT
jgi:hypothetical protein